MLVTELKKSHESKIVYHSSIMSNLQNEYNRIESHIETMYEDHLDGRITKNQYDKLLESKKKRQQEILDTMETHRKADKTYYITAERLLTLASHAVDYYKSSKPDEKRQLLNFLLSNCKLKHKKLDFTLKQPFDTILLHASRSDWLPLLDAFRTQPTILQVNQTELETVQKLFLIHTPLTIVSAAAEIAGATGAGKNPSYQNSLNSQLFSLLE